MIHFDWQQILGWLFLGGSGIAGVAGLVYGLNEWRKLRWRGPSNIQAAIRSADDPAPAGAKEWVEDIATAMSGASADSVLKALRDGATRDDARSRRIAELEAAK